MRDGDDDNLDPNTVRDDLNQWKRPPARSRSSWTSASLTSSSSTKSSVPDATYDELDNAIDEVGTFLREYSTLLTASWIADMEPHIQPDWKRPFRQPLFER